MKKNFGHFFSMPQFDLGNLKLKNFVLFFAFEKKFFLGLRKFLENFGIFFFLCIVKVSLCLLCVLQVDSLKNSFVLKNGTVTGMPKAFRPLLVEHVETLATQFHEFCFLVLDLCCT